MNKSKNISLFLSAILVAGTVTSIFPSFIVGVDAQALPNYRLDNYKSLPYKKDDIKCNNFNLNANGGLNVNTIPESLRGLISSQGQAEEDFGTSTYDTDEKRFGSYDDNKKDFIYKCVNNNHNKQTTPPPPTDVTETLTVIKNVDCQASITVCENNPILPSDFTILIEGNNPSQNTFLGSSTGTDIELESGPYSITEEGLDTSPHPVCTRIGYEASSSLGNNLFICTNFSDGCEGEITLGTPQTCTIDNVLVFCEVTVDTITEVGDRLWGIAHDPVNQRMYVAIQDDNSVTVIDTNTNAVIDRIQVGNNPAFLAYDPINLDMYVTNFNSGTVSVIDTTTNTVIATITVGDSPRGIAYDPINKYMYVANFNSGTVSVIDTTTNTVIDVDLSTPEIDPITLGGEPAGIAYDPVNKRMYVSNAELDIVSIIDTTTNTVIDVDPSTPEIDPIPVGINPLDMAYDPVNQRMYVANFFENTVSVIDTTTNTVIATITVGNTPEGVAYDSLNKDMYVTNTDDDTVSVIDTTTNTVIGGPIQVGDFPGSIVYDPVNHRMYVSNIRDDTVSVINLCSSTQFQQQQITKDIITTTANKNYDTILKSVIQQKDVTTKDITTNKNIIEQKEEQKLAEEQKIQKSNVMSPPSLP